MNGFSCLIKQRLRCARIYAPRFLSEKTKTRPLVEVMHNLEDVCCELDLSCTLAEVWLLLGLKLQQVERCVSITDSGSKSKFAFSMIVESSIRAEITLSCRDLMSSILSNSTHFSFIFKCLKVKLSPKSNLGFICECSQTFM